MSPAHPAAPLWAAAAASVVRRRPVRLDGRPVGSVAEAHLPLLAAEPGHFEIADGAVTVRIAAGEREAVLDALHRRWRAAGIVRAWRDERYALADTADGTPLVPIERAAARFWGALTLGAHATGFVRGPDGRPEAVWIARRSATKPTDPGLLDNLVGGGVPSGQPVREALVREAWEEAGLDAATASSAAARGPARVLRIGRDVPEGYQLEWLYAFDLELPRGTEPRNQDGEVDGFRLMPVAEALALAVPDTMTIDAALVTWDFALRHGLAAPHNDKALERALEGWTVDAAVAGRLA